MLAMDQGVVEEWLSEYKTLPDNAVSNYAASLKDKGALVPALYKVIRENYSDEIVDKDGQSKVLSFTVPSLSKPSVYHEPSTIGSMALTEGALANHGLSRVAYSGPHIQRETFTAQNRFEVLTFLLLCYNAALSYMTPSSLQALCQLSSRVCICGYPRQQLRRYKGISSRLTVTSEFLVQLITGIHYALCNGDVEVGSKALDDVLYRAQLELFPEALLVGNAIKSSMHCAALKSNNKEGPRSIQVEITPTASRISRNAVTSLSIRGHRWKRHDAVDLGSPDELMEISEVDEGVWPGLTAPGDAATPTITISNSFTTPSLGARAMKKCRLAGRTSKDKEAGQAPGGRATSESAELSVKRLTLTSSQSVPKAGALSNLTRTASAVFSRSFEASSAPVPNHLHHHHHHHHLHHAGSDAGVHEAAARYSCSMQEEGLGYLNPGPSHSPLSTSISVHLGPDL
uniref:Hyccin PI4KA lipid kinase complex subunit 1 n=1 Tax=Gadus morhua TaxID=8049 RepID=A0A8C5C734_GADMO